MHRYEDQGSSRDGLARGAPADCGVDPRKVTAFLDEVKAAGLDLHGLMIHRKGRIAVEAYRWPYGAARPRIMHSAAKSFTACAVGMAIAEGHFALNDPVVGFFPDHVTGAIGANLAAMTVEHLLTMRTGHDAETSGAIWRGIDTSWISAFFSIPVVHRPGTHYVYTSAASYMLSAILTRTTGVTLHDYLIPRLFRPLGITGEHWDVGPDGINPGGNGLTCLLSDLLKLGLLHEQGGLWNGRRILSADWIARATARQADADYGYHWIVNPSGSYAALGMFFQTVRVFPQAGATMAVIAAIDGSHRIMPTLGKYFPAAFADDATDDGGVLAHRLAEMSAPQTLSAQADRKSGRREFVIAPNRSGVSRIVLDLAPERCVFTLVDAQGAHQIAAGFRDWIEGATDMPGRELHHGYAFKDTPVIAGAVWRDENNLDLTWIFVESAFTDRVTCRFTDTRVVVERQANVNTGPTAAPPLEGTLAEASE